MKRNFIVIAAGLFCVLFSSCTNKKAEFIKLLSETMASDTATLSNIYPDAKDMELNRVTFDPATVTATEDEKEFQLTVGDATINIVSNEQGEYHIASTKGLLKVDPAVLAFAKETGWYKPELTDKENSIALQDTVFPKNLKEAFINEAISGVSVKVVDYAENYSSMTKKMKVVVTNNSSANIKADMYTIGFRYKSFNWDTMRDTWSSQKNYDGVDVDANGTAAIELGTFDAEGTFGGKATIEWRDNLDIVALGFKATGNEYDEYKKSKTE